MVTQNTRQTNVMCGTGSSEEEHSSNNNNNTEQQLTTPTSGSNSTSSNNSNTTTPVTVTIQPLISNTKLMVNYIPEMITRDMMYNLFSAHGSIDSCKLIANRGYGFVDFTRSDDALQAKHAFDGLSLQGKTLKVSFALLNPESKPPPRTEPDSNLYISNLPADLSLDRLHQLFSPYGNITNSRLAQGIAFVCYENRTQAEAAINRLNGYTPPGSGAAGPLSVKFANKPGAARPSPAPRPPPAAMPQATAIHLSGPTLHNPAFNGVAGPAPAMTLNGGGLQYAAVTGTPLLPSPGKALPFLNKGQQRYNPLAPSSHVTHPSLSLLAQQSPLLAAAPPRQTTVYVYNVAEDTQELSLWQLFGPYGAIDSIKVIKDAETKKNKGFAFVNMRVCEEAAAAISALNGFTLDGQVLSVSFKTQKRK